MPFCRLVQETFKGGDMPYLGLLANKVRCVGACLRKLASRVCSHVRSHYCAHAHVFMHQSVRVFVRRAYPSASALRTARPLHLLHCACTTGRRTSRTCAR